MSTLTEMREALEQLEQDARRFRWLAAHLEPDLLSDMQSLCGMEDAAVVLALFRQLADERRNPVITPSGAPHGARRFPETPGPTEPAGAQT